MEGGPTPDSNAAFQTPSPTLPKVSYRIQALTSISLYYICQNYGPNKKHHELLLDDLVIAEAPDGFSV